MIKNYLLIAFRNLSKNKAFSFINITGLAIGMAAGLLIIQYVSFELSFDNFHAKKDRVYRVSQDRYDRGKLSTQWAGGAFGAGNAFKNNFPEVEDFVKVVGNGSLLAVYKDQRLTLDKTYFAGPSFFNIFSYPLINGDPKTALQDVNSAVVTESVAKKLFGTTDAVGKTFIWDVNSLKVTGVMKDFPANTHFKTEMLISYATLMKFVGPKSDLDVTWLNDGCLTYLLLKPGVDPKALEAKFVPFVDKTYRKINWSGASAKYHLQPLQSIHLYSHLMQEAEPNGDGKSVYLLAAIAIFVIIIAWINYINLATAKGITRAKEVGVRKTLGSAKSQLLSQFMFEAMLLNGLAILLSIILIILFLPIFSAISGQYITLTLLFKPIFWIGVVILFLLGSFFSGFYPAIVLSNFKPVEVIKGKLSASPKGIVMRKVMVVFQFAASIFLLIFSLTVYRQVSYMQNQKLGINIDQTLIIKQPLAHVDSFYRSMSAFKNESLRDPSVKSVTVSTSIPGDPVQWNAGGIKLTGTDQSQGKQYRIIGGDYDYLKAYNAKLITGRLFSKDFTTDPHAVVFNVKATQEMGFEKPEQAIGKQIDFWGQVYTIIGVVDNYHQQSLHDAFDAVIFRCIPDVRGQVSVKINTTNLPQTIAALKKNWNAFFPGDEFNYFFLDQHFNEQYHADKQFGQVFATFTGIGIFVACLGLFGLVSFTIVQRTKEIGIRKVLGASVNSILQLLYKDFAQLVVISFIISAPLGWYAIHQWLQTYAFRIGISWTLFVIPFIAVAVIAMTTVSYLSVKAALMNPVKSIKTE
ncbi:ABC transporter permease [Mucilaginibacter sp. X4EP1]|uniref:ABC transporter permease n=1 Tax=Mucilaginibacter sp. X4EP1 TaxID=2723092 RepID=UPI0021694CE9|nr:ABC transporter permease [Mucilaginibacter sp. X4EP1]MCS3813016.1 putative ABC transport system permease protein [Mucilaginibacter sp. X4EP1]